MIPVNLQDLGGMCPSQFLFTSEDGAWQGYARYRWGHLSIYLSPKESDNWPRDEEYEVVGVQLGGPYDGYLQWESVLPHVLPIEPERDWKNAKGAWEEHVRRYRCDPGYRRAKMREHILEMRDWDLARARDEAESNAIFGAAPQPSSREATEWTDAFVNQLVDNAELSYQARVFWEQCPSTPAVARYTGARYDAFSILAPDAASAIRDACTLVRGGDRGDELRSTSPVAIIAVESETPVKASHGADRSWFTTHVWWVSRFHGALPEDHVDADLI